MNGTSTTAFVAVEIGLPATDMAPMRRFYCDGIGLLPYGTVDLPSAHIEGFCAGLFLLKFTVYTDETQRPSPKHPSLQSPYFTIRVADIAIVVARCEAMGFAPLYPVASATTAMGRTVRFTFFADPMGNRIEIVEGDAWQRLD